MDSSEKAGAAGGGGGKGRQMKGVALSGDQFKLDSSGNLQIDRAAIDEVTRGAVSRDALTQVGKGGDAAAAARIRITIGIDF
jgi:hypothetical protein